MKEIGEDSASLEKIYEFRSDGERYVLHVPKWLMEDKMTHEIFMKRFPQIFTQKICARQFVKRKNATGQVYDAILITARDIRV